MFESNGFNRSDDITLLLQRLYGTRRGDIFRSDLYDLWLMAQTSAEGEPGPLGQEDDKRIFAQGIEEAIAKLEFTEKFIPVVERSRADIELSRQGVPDGPGLDRLLRYEASLERSFDRILSQLDKLQRTRRGQPVLPELNVRVSKDA